MIVTSYREDPFLSLHHVHTFNDFFTAVQTELNEAIHFKSIAVRAVGVDKSQQFLSLSLPLANIDPLQALQVIAKPHQDYFYWENGRTGEAIAAVGDVKKIHVSGQNRFQTSKQAIQSLFQDVVFIGHPTHPFGRPQIFCRFTFFNTVEQTAPFAPATLVFPQWQISANRDCSNLVANVPLPNQNGLLDSCAEIWAMLSRLRSMGTQTPSTSNAVSDTSNLSSYHQKIRPSHDCLENPPLNAPLPLMMHSPQKRNVGPKSLWRSLSQGKHNRFRPHSQRISKQSSTTQKNHPSLLRLPEADQTQLIQTIQAVLNTIEKTTLNKAVLAHALDIQLESPLNALSSLQTLRQCHSDCYVFATQNAHGQTFLCASPERLLSTREGALSTEALAGTAPRGTTPSEDARYANALLTNRKELHEHQLVVNFICQQLAELGLETQRSLAPCLLPLSTIQHLQTPIYAELAEHLHPFDVLANLHPTPAVAGVPRDLACELIQQHEVFERSLYASPMGWIDDQGNSEFLVGIRSALLNDNQVRLYAGAGIVQGSNPKQELAEIELKLRSLYSTLIHPNQ